MLDWGGAQPGTLDDVGHLASLYASGIETAPDLREAILAASHNSIRRICNNLDEVRKVAAVEGSCTHGPRHLGRSSLRAGQGAVWPKQYGMSRRPVDQIAGSGNVEDR